MADEFNITDVFLSNLRNIHSDNISEEMMEKAKNCFLDYVGCAVAGSSIIKNDCLSYANSIGDSVGDAYIFGLKKKTTIQTAALLNGISAHFLELDDGHRGGGIHVGATVFSALLAIAKKEKLSGADFLYGSIIGYESTIRLALAIQPGNKIRGYHVSGTCGTIGAAMGIAAALHFTKEQTNTTLASAVAGAAGVLEMQEDDSCLKPYNVGRAAMDAISACYIGWAGIKGPKDALGGRRGFLKVMTDTPHPEFLSDFDDEYLYMTQIYQKIYAACRHAHPSIDAALSLRAKVRVEEIESIEVRTYKLAVYGHDHTVIQGVNSAKMSIPFCVATALITGKADYDAFTHKTVSDFKILSLTKKVKVIEDEELTVQCPRKRASILIIKTISGKFCERIDYPKGEPENPLTHKELFDKFHSLAMLGGITGGKSDDLIAELYKKDFNPTILINIANS